MIRWLALCLALVLAAGCTPLAGTYVLSPLPGALRALEAGGPTYCFVRAYHAPGLGSDGLSRELANRWLPAVARLHGQGLNSCVSAQPPGDEDGLPDAIMLTAFVSEAGYQRARISGDGTRLAALEDALFDPARTVTSLVLAWSETDALVAGKAYDVMRQPVDWQGGFTTFFIGRRHEAVPAHDFLNRLGAQVRRERRAFAGQGLSGYVFVATEDYKLSFMHWSDRAAFARAMQSPAGQEVVTESRSLMRTVQFAGAAGFSGVCGPGQVLTLGF